MFDIEFTLEVIPARAKTINELLKKAGQGSLILQSADGRRFVLASIEGWHGFNVGAGDDFAAEVNRTVRNRKLMNALAARRSGGPRMALAKVKTELGLK